MNSVEMPVPSFPSCIQNGLPAGPADVGVALGRRGLGAR